MREPTTQTIYDLFNSRIQFIVPTYQRSYVWNEADNWAPLWDDIEDTVRRFDSSGLNKHFLGPIVLEQQDFAPGAVDLRLVIDGQQRLTTLQVLLGAAKGAAKRHNCSSTAEELGDLILNRGKAAQEHLRFKVWPSRRDRDAFVQVIETEHTGNTGLAGAYRYFSERIEEWLADDDEDLPPTVTERLDRLQICICNLVYVVSINLEPSDNAQVIFETLNARGTGLGALDLVKNAVLLQAERKQESADKLYEKYWEPAFEANADDYWLEETRQGREKRPRSDWFLMHWLAAEKQVVVRADKLFNSFRTNVLHTEEPMTTLVPRLCKDAATMRSFDSLQEGTPEALFFSRLEELDTTTLLPIALQLFRSEGLSPDRRLRALRALESWLVRRAVLRLTTKNYNRVMVRLLRLIKSDPDRADEALISELRNSDAPTAVWPSDTDFRKYLETEDTYGRLKQSRVRMLLEAAELESRHPTKTEAVLLPRGLSIEHAMPQQWEKHWLPDQGADFESRKQMRKNHINLLGNLTLVTQPLNSDLSNKPWSIKRLQLADKAVLLITQRLCAHQEWNEESIENRCRELANLIVHAWPGPDSTAWPDTAEYVAGIDLDDDDEEVEPEQTETERLLLEFWNGLVTYIKQEKPALAPKRNPSGQNFLVAAVVRPGLRWVYGTRGLRSDVHLTIRMSSVLESHAIIDVLLNDKAAIESVFGSTLKWKSKPGQRTCKIQYNIDGGYRDSKDRWAAIHKAQVEAMVRLVQAVTPHLDHALVAAGAGSPVSP